MSNEKRTVWILGSGFSKGLGGPLLDELLSPVGQATIAAVYPNLGLVPGTEIMGQLAVLIELLEKRRSRNRSPWWRDAEEFLDQLDASRTRPSDGASWKRLVGIFYHLQFDARKHGDLRSEDHLLVGKLDPIALHAAATRVVAAQCAAFLVGANLDEERWKPYRTWARELSSSDTIVTFNYDRVLELLAERHSSKFVIIDPEDADSGHGLGLRRNTTALGPAQVFKLHGSVDWKRVAEERHPVHYEFTRDTDYAVTCMNAEEIGIATPGPSKQIAKQALKPLWDAALERIRAADAIVFVGYRFPPTDAEARHELLTAIEANAAKPEVPQHHLKIHIVLGPKLSDDVERLHRLVESVLLRAGRVPGGLVPGRRTFQIHAHRMFAEDFFTVWSPALLQGRVEA